jgi:type III secretory pathway component EscT
MAPPPPSPHLLDALGAAIEQMGIEPRAWALGMARAAPAVTLVPAFGLSAVPAPTRLVLGVALGACIAPALGAQAGRGGPFFVALSREAFTGLPVALVAALSIYVAGMAGGLIDDLRGGRESVSLPALPEPLPPVAALFTLLASVAFLETGGAARVAAALSAPQPLLGPFSWLNVTRAFARSVDLAFALAAPLAVASVLLETASALIARAATPASVGPVLAPVKSVALLGILALVLERLAELLAIGAGSW